MEGLSQRQHDVVRGVHGVGERPHAHVAQVDPRRQGRRPDPGACGQPQAVAQAAPVRQGDGAEPLRPVLLLLQGRHPGGRPERRVGEEPLQLPGQTEEAQEVAAVRGDGDVEHRVPQVVEGLCRDAHGGIRGQDQEPFGGVHVRQAQLLGGEHHPRAVHAEEVAHAELRAVGQDGAGGRVEHQVPLLHVHGACDAEGLPSIAGVQTGDREAVLSRVLLEGGDPRRHDAPHGPRRAPQALDLRAGERQALRGLLRRDADVDKVLQQLPGYEHQASLPDRK